MATFLSHRCDFSNSQFADLTSQKVGPKKTLNLQLNSDDIHFIIIIV